MLMLMLMLMLMPMLMLMRVPELNFQRLGRRGSLAKSIS